MVSLPIVVGFRTHADPLVFLAVVTRRLLILRAHEVADATLVHVGPAVQQELDHRRVLVHDRYVQHVFSCFYKQVSFHAVFITYKQAKNYTVVLVVYVDVVYQIWVEPQQPLGQVSVDGGGVEHAQVQYRLAYRASLVQIPADQLVLALV